MLYNLLRWGSNWSEMASSKIFEKAIIITGGPKACNNGPHLWMTIDFGHLRA